ncbi:hypothetical protein JW859_05420 [bacterium]|nr:hypothetical protein [bacterium]
MGRGDNQRDYARDYLDSLRDIPDQIQRIQNRAGWLATGIGVVLTGGAVAFGQWCCPHLTTGLGVIIGGVWFGLWLAIFTLLRRYQPDPGRDFKEMHLARLADRVRSGELRDDPWQAQILGFIRWAYKPVAPDDYQGQLLRLADNLGWFSRPPAKHFPSGIGLGLMALGLNALAVILAYGNVQLFEYAVPKLEFALVMVLGLALLSALMLPVNLLGTGNNLRKVGSYLAHELRKPPSDKL